METNRTKLKIMETNWTEVETGGKREGRGRETSEEPISIIHFYLYSIIYSFLSVSICLVLVGVMYITHVNSYVRRCSAT